MLFWMLKNTEFTESKATGKAVVGAEFTAWDCYILGRNMELEKAKRILQEWITTDWPKGYPPSRLEFTFKNVDGKTELAMIHSDVPADQEEELEQGWIEYYWKPLRAYFEKRKDN